MNIFSCLRKTIEHFAKHFFVFFDHIIAQLIRRRNMRRIHHFIKSPRTLKVTMAAFLTIVLPLYLFVGFQSAIPVDALDYSNLEISSINLKTPVAPLELINHQLETPATIAGSYSQFSNKTLIIGHSSTVFKNLTKIQVGNIINYSSKTYQVQFIETKLKTEVNMSGILANTNTETLIIMTCAGDPLPNQDATHRLIVTATRVTE